MTAPPTTTPATTLRGREWSCAGISASGCISNATADLTTSGPTSLMSTAASSPGTPAPGSYIGVRILMDTAMKVGRCPSPLHVTPRRGRGVITPTNTANSLVTRPTTPAMTPACPGRRCVGASAGVRETIRCAGLT